MKNQLEIIAEKIVKAEKYTTARYHIKRLKSDIDLKPYYTEFFNQLKEAKEETELPEINEATNQKIVAAKWRDRPPKSAKKRTLARYFCKPSHFQIPEETRERGTGRLECKESGMLKQNIFYFRVLCE